MNNKKVWALMGIILLLAVAQPASAPVTLNVQLTLKSSDYTGPCPVTLEFKGTIQASGPCHVVYRFTRSDSAVSAQKTMVFSAAGKQPVTYSWSLGHKLSGWVQLEAGLSGPVFPPSSSKLPRPLVTSRANFSVTCTSPQITDAHLHHHGQPAAEIDIVGTNFGASPGSREVTVDGVTMAPAKILSWTNTQISIAYGIIIHWDHIYQIAITEGGSAVSNVFNARFPVAFDGIVPTSGVAGSEFTLNIFGLAPSPGTNIPMMGTTPCTIVSWTGTATASQLRATVPSLPAGVFDVFIQRGSEIISQKVKFTIL